MAHLVLIGDLVASRQAPDRRDLQHRLEAILQTLNTASRPPVSPYTLTLGDEFQAVFDNADRVFEDIVQIMQALHPVQVRFSLGLGEITTDLNFEQALGMDGPAFYRARDGITQLKSQGDMLHVEGLPEVCDELATASLRLLDKWIEKWESNRLAVLHRLLTGSRVKDIATGLNITEQAVYKNINSGQLEIVMQVIRALTGILNAGLAGETSSG